MRFARFPSDPDSICAFIGVSHSGNSTVGQFNAISRAQLLWHGGTPRILRLPMDDLPTGELKAALRILTWKQANSLSYCEDHHKYALLEGPTARAVSMDDNDAGERRTRERLPSDLAEDLRTDGIASGEFKIYRPRLIANLWVLMPFDPLRHNSEMGAVHHHTIRALQEQWTVSREWILGKSLLARESSPLSGPGARFVHRESAMDAGEPTLLSAPSIYLWLKPSCA